MITLKYRRYLLYFGIDMKVWEKNGKILVEGNGYFLKEKNF